MYSKKIAATIAATFITTTALTAWSSPATADPLSVDDTRDAIAGTIDTAVLEAMERDLGLNAEQAYDRIAIDKVATEIEDIAASEFSDSYAGTWVNEAGTGTTVAVTDKALGDDIEALGATPVIVDDTLAELDTALQALNAVDTVPGDVHSWYIDVTTNAITITAATQTAATDLIDRAELDATEIHIEHSAERAEPLYNIRGGDAFYMGGGRCSVGFSVNHSGGSGFVTAGHCGTTGTAVQGYNQVAMGSFAGSVFPSSDYGWVSTNSNWTSTPKVNGYGQTDFTVTNRTEAATGATVCRSGSTTGVYCGTIGLKNQTVSYPQGTVYGMTRTNVCAEPGDSGGSWISGTSAQGVTSGGSGNCTSGGVTYFYPLTPIFNAYPAITLTTA